LKEKKASDKQDYDSAEGDKLKRITANATYIICKQYYYNEKLSKNAPLIFSFLRLMRRLTNFSLREKEDKFVQESMHE